MRIMKQMKVTGQKAPPSLTDHATTKATNTIACSDKMTADKQDSAQMHTQQANT